MQCPAGKQYCDIAVDLLLRDQSLVEVAVVEAKVVRTLGAFRLDLDVPRAAEAEGVAHRLERDSDLRGAELDRVFAVGEAQKHERRGLGGRRGRRLGP